MHFFLTNSINKENNGGENNDVLQKICSVNWGEGWLRHISSLTHLFVHHQIFTEYVVLGIILSYMNNEKVWFLPHSLNRGNWSVSIPLHHHAECYNKNISTLLWKHRVGVISSGCGSWAKLHRACDIWAGCWRMSRCLSSKETAGKKHEVHSMFWDL